MTLLIIAYFGGILTILSPCILPVLPLVFARAQHPFFKVTLPMLAGMAVTFAAVATLAAFGGSWAVHANIYGRAIALVLLAVFGVTLVSPRFANWLTLPIVSFGNRLLNSTGGPRASATTGGSVLLGVATGLLWAPCAGPILGLILTGAAVQGATAGTTLMLLAYSAGAATSLALAVLVGGRVFAIMKQSLGAGDWLRRGLGVAVLVGWAEKYKDQGLVVIGVHAPEFAFERKIDNVKEAVERFEIAYPVAIDNDYKIWRAFRNNYWPAHYFIDAKGQIRYHHFGEGAYDESEKVIQALLAEAVASKEAMLRE